MNVLVKCLLQAADRVKRLSKQRAMIQSEECIGPIARACEVLEASKLKMAKDAGN